MQDHLNVCASDGTTTTLTFHLVCTQFTEPLVATWHKRDTRITVWTRQTSHDVIAVSGWGGDGRDDGVCAGVIIISRIVARRKLSRVSAP